MKVICQHFADEMFIAFHLHFAYTCSCSLNDFLNNLAIRILSFHLHSFSVVRCHWGGFHCVIL